MELVRAAPASDLSSLLTAFVAQELWATPDAPRYTCESCGEKAVFGAEELVFTSRLIAPPRLTEHYRYEWALTGKNHRNRRRIGPFPCRPCPCLAVLGQF